MSRIIDADNTVKTICGYYCGCERDECWSDDPCEAVAFIEAAPALSPDEVRGAGEWIEAAGGNYLVCPECKYDHALYDRLGYSCEHEYCPNCGKRLRMKGAETSE